MTQQCILKTAAVLALLTLPLKSEQLEFDWSALHRRVTDLLQHGSIAESKTVLEESIKAAHQRGESSTGLAEVLNDLGTLYHDSGRFAEAERAYRESVSIWRRIPETNPGMGIALGNLAGLRLVQGRPSEAEKLYMDAERLLITACGVESTDVANLRSGLADVYWEMGKYENARRLGERALSVLETAGRTPQFGVALFIVAKTAWKQNRDEEAERLLRRAIEIWRTSLGPQHPTFASGLVSLAVLISRKNPREADQLFAQALQSVETQLGPGHVFTGYTLVLYAQHLEGRGRKGEQKRLKRRGEEILVRHSRDNLLGHTLDIKAFQRPNAR